MTALERAIEIAGSVAALAAALDVAASAPSMWKARGRVPAEHCPAIEKATAGGVRCEDLRPDVDWAVLRQHPPAPTLPPPDPADWPLVKQRAHGGA
jgi:DNA-binding transcriptional regulator YdaS (Cro superfamily)